MKIYAAFLSQETNTFSPIPTGFSDFDVIRAEDIREGCKRYDDFQPLGIWQRQISELGHEFLFDFAALATPSGIASRKVYESFRDEIIRGLQRQGSVDVVLLNLHGAMVAEGYEDCEGDLIRHVREVVGDKTVIGVELDLHCHLTSAMVSMADIIITYKEYPHDDICERGNELLNISLAVARGQHSPTMAVFDCRMLGMYPTSEPALRDFIDNHMKALEQRPEVISVSFAHGFPWGDVKEGGSKLLVTTDNDMTLAQALARELGMTLSARRHQISFPCLPMEEAFPQALAMIQEQDSPHQPVVVADQSDNPGGGAPSDATYALHWLLEHGVKNAALAIFYDPEVVRLAIAAGLGAKLSVRLGGKLGKASGNPLDICVEVLSFQSNYFHNWPQKDGSTIKWPVGDVVALDCEGIGIIVGSKRCQCFSPSIFTDLGIAYKCKDLLVVKSMQHFHSAFNPIARAIIYMAGPGAVAPIVQDINYQNMSTADKFPWVEDPLSLEEQTTSAKTTAN